MPDDPIAVLERELVDAARRRVRPDEASVPVLGAPSVRRRRRSLGSFAAVVVSALAVVVALGALVSLRGSRPGPHTVPSRPAKIPGRRQLIDILGALRRPQTAADLPAQLLAELEHTPPFTGTPDVSLIRLATTTPWGDKLFLVPMKPSTSAQIEAFDRQHHLPRPQFAGRARTRRETLGVFSASGGGGGAGDVAAIEAGQGIGTEGGSGVRGTRVTLVVPDGVARVKFVLPRQPEPQQYGAPVYPHSLTVSAPVHDNVVAVQVARNLLEVPFPMIWYGADGRVIKRIGNLAGVNRVVPTPQPGPETPLSRAAERDPSTPNRVWVTPSVGGPHTTFMVHFLVLLNGATYGYRLSGTRCPAITMIGGDGGGTQDLRGRIWSEQVGAVQGQPWCPGTYHLSVSIAGIARHPPRPRGPKPFGTATFRVTR